QLLGLGVAGFEALIDPPQRVAVSGVGVDERVHGRLDALDQLDGADRALLLAAQVLVDRLDEFGGAAMAVAGLGRSASPASPGAVVRRRVAVAIGAGAGRRVWGAGAALVAGLVGLGG